MKICDFVKSEVEQCLSDCNFTKEQAEIFLLFSAGYTNDEVAEKCNISLSTAKRIKKQIKAKIERIVNL